MIADYKTMYDSHKSHLNNGCIITLGLHYVQLDIDRETISRNIFHNSWHIRLSFHNLCLEVRFLYTSLISCVCNISQENMMTITLCRVLFFFSLTKKIGLSVVILYHYTKNENILNPTHIPAGEEGFT